jgi:hypothetical protein
MLPCHSDTSRRACFGARDVALGDVDGDGDLDIVTANPTANCVWINDGMGSFTDSLQALGTGNTLRVALGDVEGDGDLDIVAGNASSQANRIWTNDGTGTFTSGQGLGSSNTYGAEFGDVDDDGDLNIVAANVTFQGNRVWTNDGAGAFTDSGQTLGSSSTLDVVLGDVDGDGDLDFIADNGSGEVDRVWINGGAGQFADSGQTLGDTTTIHLALGDVDGDGDLDCVTGNEFTEANSVYRNNSAVPNTLPSAPAALAANVSGSDVTFSWSAASDNETLTPALTYNLRVGTAPDTDDVMPAHAVIGGATDGERLVPAMGNVQHNTSWTVKSLAAGTYYWSVQAVDTAFAGSTWAAEETVTVP